MHNPCRAKQPTPPAPRPHPSSQRAPQPSPFGSARLAQTAGLFSSPVRSAFFASTPFARALLRVGIGRPTPPPQSRGALTAGPHARAPARGAAATAPSPPLYAYPAGTAAPHSWGEGSPSHHALPLGTHDPALLVPFCSARAEPVRLAQDSPTDRHPCTALVTRPEPPPCTPPATLQQAWRARAAPPAARRRRRRTGGARVTPSAGTSLLEPQNTPAIRVITHTHPCLQGPCRPCSF